MGSGLGTHPKIWDPLLISATMKASNSNLVHNFGLGSSSPRYNFYDQNWRGSGLDEHPKIWDSLLIFAAAEASNFKFGIQLGFGE